MQAAPSHSLLQHSTSKARLGSGEHLSQPKMLVLPRAARFWLRGQLPRLLETWWMVAVAELVPAVAGPRAGGAELLGAAPGP